MKIKFLLLLGFVFLSLMGCEDADDVIATPVGGRCYITQSTTEIICIDFANDSDTNTNASTCETEFDRYSNSNGASGRDYTSGNGNICDTTNKVGTCQVGQNQVHYFPSEFNATTAENDCTNNQSGTWSP